MNKKIFGIVAVPGSGKTWITKQLGDKFHLCHHDLHLGMAGGAYVEAILEAAETATKPLLIEMPFSMRDIMEPLEQEGFEIEPVFIVEDPDLLSRRYELDRGKPIPKGHLTRMATYAQRAKAMGAFAGTSSQVLEHLKNV